MGEVGGWGAEALLVRLDQREDVFAAPDSDAGREFDRGWEAARFYAFPPAGFLYRDEADDRWSGGRVTDDLLQAQKAGFGDLDHGLLSPFDKGRCSPVKTSCIRLYF